MNESLPADFLIKVDKAKDESSLKKRNSREQGAAELEKLSRLCDVAKRIANLASEKHIETDFKILLHNNRAIDCWRILISSPWEDMDNPQRGLTSGTVLLNTGGIAVFTRGEVNEADITNCIITHEDNYTDIALIGDYSSRGVDKIEKGLVDFVIKNQLS